MCENGFETSRNPIIIKDIKEVLRYATKRYKCEFPKNFAKTLYDMSYQQSYCILTYKVMDAIYTEWKIWERYVTPKSFNSFMKASIKDMCRLGATTTFSCSELKGYIGNKATVIKEIPRATVTTVVRTGKLTQNDRVVKYRY